MEAVRIEQNQNDRRALARKKREQDKEQLEEELNKPDPLIALPEVAIRDYLIKYLDTLDRISLCRASPYVRETMGTAQATWVMKLALESVPQLYETITAVAPKDPDDYEHDNFTALTALRGVCRDYKFAVDNYFNNVAYCSLPNYSKPNYNYRALLSPLETPTTDGLHDHVNWDKCLSLNQQFHRMQFHSSLFSVIPEYDYKRRSEKILARYGVAGGGGSPFLTRFINLSLYFGDFEDASFTEVMNRYGREIRGAGLTLMGLYVPLEHYLEDMHRMIRMTPELQAVSFKGVTENQYEEEDNGGDFPPLEKLRMLFFPRGCCSPLFPTLANYFNQLHTLAVDDKCFMARYDPGRHSKFPNLKRASVRVGTVEHLMKLREWTGVLREVDIGVERELHLELAVFLYALMPSWEGLVAISLGQSTMTPFVNRAVGLAELGLPELEEEVKLPGLQVMVVRVGCKECNTLEGLQYIKCSLKFLQVMEGRCDQAKHESSHESSPVKEHQHEEHSREEILVRECLELEDIYESRIWNVFPELEEILLVRIVPKYSYYTRASYNARRQ